METRRRAEKSSVGGLASDLIHPSMQPCRPHLTVHTHSERAFVLLSCWNPGITIKKLLTPCCSLLSVPTPPVCSHPLFCFLHFLISFTDLSLSLGRSCCPSPSLHLPPSFCRHPVLSAVRIKPGSTSPVEYQSDSDAESGTESGSASLSAQSLDAG